MMVKSRTFIATPPGATIKEQLLDKGMSQKEFATRMDLSQKHVSKLINGEVQLTPDVAVRLEMVLGIPAKFWNKLEATYREKLIKANAENEMDADIEIARKMPYNEMVKYGWVPVAKKIEEKVVNLRKFFGVVSLVLLKDMRLSRIACRRLADTEKSNYALMAWAQQARILARDIKVSSIDLKTLEHKLSEIRSMTTLDPDVFCTQLENLLAGCGIALIFLPHIGGSFLHGATFVDGNKIVIDLTVRGKDVDRFWFSLFHELGHILLGHINNIDGTTEEDENSADQFAQEILIPTADLGEFVSQNDFSRSSICDFAEKENIQSGIVVGRLQKEHFINYNQYNDLKIKYEITS